VTKLSIRFVFIKTLHPKKDDFNTCYAQPNFASPRDSINVILALPNSSLPLAQCIGFEVGEPFKYVARLSGANVCLELEGTFDRVHVLARTHLKVSCDVYVHEDSSSPGSNYVVPNPIDHSHVSTMYP